MVGTGGELSHVQCMREPSLARHLVHQRTLHVRHDAVKCVRRAVSPGGLRVERMRRDMSVMGRGLTVHYGSGLDRLGRGCRKYEPSEREPHHDQRGVSINGQGRFSKPSEPSGISIKRAVFSVRFALMCLAVHALAGRARMAGTDPLRPRNEARFPHSRHVPGAPGRAAHTAIDRRTATENPLRARSIAPQIVRLT
jgi:hypothetical protein